LDKEGSSAKDMCWGSELKGLAGASIEPCTKGFVIGTGHLIKKFCPACLNSGVLVPRAHIYTVPASQALKFRNLRGGGLWSTAVPRVYLFKPSPRAETGPTDEMFHVRVINQTAKCKGDPLVIFRVPPPPDALVPAAPFDGLLTDFRDGSEDLVRLTVAYGTLVPSTLMLNKRPRFSMAASTASGGDASAEGKDKRRRRQRCRPGDVRARGEDMTAVTAPEKLLTVATPPLELAQHSFPFEGLPLLLNLPPGSPSLVPPLPPSLVPPEPPCSAPGPPCSPAEYAEYACVIQSATLPKPPVRQGQLGWPGAYHVQISSRPDGEGVRHPVPSGDRMPMARLVSLCNIAFSAFSAIAAIVIAMWIHEGTATVAMKATAGPAGHIYRYNEDSTSAAAISGHLHNLSSITFDSSTYGGLTEQHFNKNPNFLAFMLPAALGLAAEFAGLTIGEKWYSNLYGAAVPFVPGFFWVRDMLLSVEELERVRMASAADEAGKQMGFVLMLFVGVALALMPRPFSWRLRVCITEVLLTIAVHTTAYVRCPKATAGEILHNVAITAPSFCSSFLIAAAVRASKQ